MNLGVIVKLRATAALFVGVAWSMAIQGQDVPGCGSLQNAYGPFDYRDPVARRDFIPVVDAFHFNADVESLARGQSGTVLGDLTYTLRAVPNHHRALRSVGKYGLKGGRFPPDTSVPSAECFFVRAIAFRPEDETVRTVYANFLLKAGNRAEARKQYEVALRLAPQSVEISYVSGLFFLEIGDLPRAKILADIAYGGGYPLPGLKNLIAAAEAAKRPKAR